MARGIKNAAELQERIGGLMIDAEHLGTASEVVGFAQTATGGVVTFDIGSLTDDAEVDIEIRAVNSVGDGAGSDVKAVTPTTA